jgi:hypothetical protein
MVPTGQEDCPNGSDLFIDVPVWRPLVFTWTRHHGSVVSIRRDSPGPDDPAQFGLIMWLPERPVNDAITAVLRVSTIEQGIDHAMSQARRNERWAIVDLVTLQPVHGSHVHRDE